MISPDAMFTICAVVSLVFIGIIVAGEKGAAEFQRESRPVEWWERASYADTMRYLGVPEEHPPGMMVGLWGKHPNTPSWWWRCTLCREYDLWLTPDQAAAASASHECSTVDLEAAKAEARALHPAWRVVHDPDANPDPRGGRLKR